ncbi:MAG: hypothetical protein ACYCSS_09255 [Sulfuriferula sp.]
MKFAGQYRFWDCRAQKICRRKFCDSLRQSLRALKKFIQATNLAAAFQAIPALAAKEGMPHLDHANVKHQLLQSSLPGPG